MSDTRRGQSGSWAPHYVFDAGDRPFGPSSVAACARNTWSQAGLQPIGLHDARHAAASILIDAGVSVKALSTYMGHAGITITLDRYGHLFPGNEEEAAGLIDAYLERVKAEAPVGFPQRPHSAKVRKARGMARQTSPL